MQILWEAVDSIGLRRLKASVRACLVLSEDDSLCSCLEDYCSILLFPYSISSGGALESPDLLLSYCMIASALHITIILIITLTYIFQPLI